MPNFRRKVVKTPPALITPLGLLTDVEVSAVIGNLSPSTNGPETGASFILRREKEEWYE